ncbi:MAG: PaaI family thioesterase [Halioglobus sp.]|jgi:uncharacterized protein (TIGR00369 family)
MSDKDTVGRLSAHLPKFIDMLGGRISAADAPGRTCSMDFDISRDFCHSVDIVQGGFITAMLDAAMTHAIFAADADVVNVSSLEIKTNYLEPTRAGHLRAVGTVVKSGYRIAFMEGRLYDDRGLLTATASTVAKLVRS